MSGPAKPLLIYRGDPFLTCAIRTLRAADLESVVVVLGHRAEEVRSAVDLSRVTVVVNEGWRSGMLSSLKTGLAAMPSGVAGMLMTLVDLPALEATTCRAVIDAWQADPSRIVRPVHAGRRGHPVIFPAAIFDRIRSADYADGPRGLLRDHAALVTGIPVDDPGCVRDIDTPDEYRALAGE